MAQLLYYFPGVISDIDKAVGTLNWLPCSPSHAHLKVGPGGAAEGTICSAWTDSPGRLLVDDDRQSGIGPTRDDGLMVGRWNDAVPGPKDLRRPRQIAGELVRLHDGNDWLIPAARFAPRVWTYIAGEMMAELDRAFEYLWKHAEYVVQHYRGKGDGEPVMFDPQEVFKVVAEVIATNYYLAPDPRIDLSLLKLIGTEEWSPVFEALCDVGADLGTKKN